MDWLKSLPAIDRKEVGRDLMRAQWRWPVGMPLVQAKWGKGFGKSGATLKAIASPACCSAYTTGRWWRCGFIKKTQKTSPDDVALAIKRMKEITTS